MGKRDTAVGGLAAMLCRSDWRLSGEGSAIAAAVRAALRDDNPLVRMQAARGVLALNVDADAEQRASIAGELLLAERDDRVREVFLSELARTAPGAPAVVDDVLARDCEGADCGHLKDDDQGNRTLDNVLAYLAVVPNAAYASATVERWCAQAPDWPGAVTRFAQCARPYIGRPGGEGQIRAFALLRTAAEACTTRLERAKAAHVPPMPLTEAQTAEIGGALRVCHAIAEQIYFASGAFDNTEGSSAHLALPDGGFADLAVPVLRACASTGAPQCVHPAVETMVFLAPLDEARTLRDVADAVSSGSGYAGESLAGDVVVAYLRRLLTEQRQLVLFDVEGADAFRRLLATFAAAGNQEALALAYTFADVFR